MNNPQPDKKKETHGGYITHSKSQCVPPCPFHAPSDHPLKDAPMHLRADKYFLVERICEHGVGHDDPDSVAYMRARGHEWAGVHGCDGCCSTESKEVAAQTPPDSPMGVSQWREHGRKYGYDKYFLNVADSQPLKSNSSNNSNSSPDSSGILGLPEEEQKQLLAKAAETSSQKQAEMMATPDKKCWRCKGSTYEPSTTSMTCLECYGSGSTGQPPDSPMGVSQWRDAYHETLPSVPDSEAQEVAAQPDKNEPHTKNFHEWTWDSNEREWVKPKQMPVQPDSSEVAARDTSKVTRFEVIDHRSSGEGRVMVEYGVNVKLSFQDDDRTLKVFLTDTNSGGRDE